MHDDDADVTSGIDPRIIAALGHPIHESHTLRRLLMRKLEKQVEKVFDNVQKAHVWLRIIREILRGFRRRALSLNLCDNSLLDLQH